MSHLERLKAQVAVPLPEGWKRMNHVYQYQGYRQHYGTCRLTSTWIFFYIHYSGVC